MPDYKIAFLDIENAPNLGYTWEQYQQNVLTFKQEWYMLSFAYKWAGETSITCKTLKDFRNGEKGLIKALWDVFDSADLIVAHNAKEFDIRKANTRFLAFDLGPPSPAKVVDTLLSARKHFRFNSNSLESLAQTLGVGKKVKTPGIGLWLGCMGGDEDCWKLMRTYNTRDVDLLEKVYYKLRPWMTTHPNITLGTGRENLACPNCGKQDPIGPRGWRSCKSWQARLYHCYRNKGGCGAWPTGKRQKIVGEILSA